MKYFGYPFASKEEFIEEIYLQEVSIDYKKAEYDIWLDGRGYCIGMNTFGTRHAARNVTGEEHERTIKAYKTPEELIDDYVLYDGVKLSEAMEMEWEDIRE